MHKYDLLVQYLSQSLTVNETIFGSTGRESTTAEHFPEPLELLRILPLILFPWILTINRRRVIYGVGRTGSTDRHRNRYDVGQ